MYYRHSSYLRDEFRQILPGTFEYTLHYLIDNKIDLSLFDGSGFCIDPTNAMQNADMAVGWVGAYCSLTLFYAYATGPYGPHPRDGNVGGVNDLIWTYGDSDDLAAFHIKRGTARLLPIVLLYHDRHDRPWPLPDGHPVNENDIDNKGPALRRGRQ